MKSLMIMDDNANRTSVLIVAHLSSFLTPFIASSVAFFVSPNANAIMSSVDKKYLGVASGTMAAMRITGQMLSMGIAMLIFALFIGQVQITPPYYHQFLKSVKAIFTIFTFLCLGGIFASITRGKLR